VLQLKSERAGDRRPAMGRISLQHWK